MENLIYINIIITGVVLIGIGVTYYLIDKKIKENQIKLIASLGSIYKIVKNSETINNEVKENLIKKVEEIIINQNDNNNGLLNVIETSKNEVKENLNQKVEKIITNQNEGLSISNNEIKSQNKEIINLTKEVQNIGNNIVNKLQNHSQKITDEINSSTGDIKESLNIHFKELNEDLKTLMELEELE